MIFEDVAEESARPVPQCRFPQITSQDGIAVGCSVAKGYGQPMRYRADCGRQDVPDELNETAEGLL